MKVQEKITKSRELYIMGKGVEPKSIILGYEIVGEMKKEFPSRFIAAGASLYGMTVIIDNNKPTRCEAGDFDT